MKWIILFLLIITGTLAYPEIFREWVEDEDDFKIGDFKIRPKYVESGALIDIDGTYLNVPDGECRMLRPLKICLNATRKTLDGEVVPDTIHSDDVEHEMLIVVQGLLADITISKEIGKTTLLINEETDVIVNLINNDLGEATQIVFEDEYPDEVKVIEGKGCYVEDNMVFWNGRLGKGESKLCKYSLLALEEKKFSAKAEIEYFNGVEEEDKSVKHTIMIKDYPIKIELDSSKNRLVAGEETVLDMFLTNDEKSEILIRRLEFFPSNGFEVLGSDELDDDNTWRGNIEKGLNISVVLKAVRTGAHALNTSVLYTIEGVEQEVVESEKFTVSPDVKVELTDNIIDFKIGEEPTVLLEITNLQERIYDLHAVVVSDAAALNDDIWVDDIGRNNAYKIINKKLAGLETGTYSVNATITYKNQFGEVFREEAVKTFDVAGAKKTQPAGNTETQTEDALPEPPRFDMGNTNSKSSGIVIIAGTILAAMLLLYLRYRVRD